MITTVHLDRHGYIVEVFNATRIPQLDAGKYPGTLMEVTGPVVVGMRWDGQAFVSPPPRIPAEAVADERHRRIETYFPERFRAQITALGGENAKAMSRYLSEVHKVAEVMLLNEAPVDYKEDRHWPTPPIMVDIPQRVHDFQGVPSVSGQPISIHVAPVINASAPAAPEARPLIIQQQAPERAEAAHYGLDINDPLYHHKLALVRSIEAMDDQGAIPDQVEPDVTAAAVMATAARSIEEFEAHKSRVHKLLEAA